MGWRSKLERARKLHRPSLADWECDGLYDTFPAYVESIEPGYQAFCTPAATSLQQQQRQSLPVTLDARELTKEMFWSEYEARNVPCVIRNIPAGYDDGRFVGEWAACKHWTLEHLHVDDELRSRHFKCGEDDDGKSIKVKLKHFLSYLDRNHDDSPLYIFDTSFDEDNVAKRLLTDYTVPSYFRDDLFQHVSESRRAPYRWWLVGPQRSGTTVHVDPLATAAWNTLLVGQKRWVLFPPHVAKRIVQGKRVLRDQEDDEAVHYFTVLLPRIQREAVARQHEPEYRDFCCYEFTQNAGETCFIPHGWWHAVLNLTDTVGVTQNFCSRRNFDQVWLQTRSGRKRMAYKWLCELEQHHPDLAARARQLNAQDGFVMKYEEMERRKARHDDKARRSKLRKTEN